MSAAEQRIDSSMCCVPERDIRPPFPPSAYSRGSACQYLYFCTGNASKLSTNMSCFPLCLFRAAAPLPHQYLHVCTSKAVSIRTFVPAKQACCALLPQRRPCSLCPKDLKQAGDRESSNLTHVFVANLRHASLADRSPETPEYKYSMSAARKACQQVPEYLSLVKTYLSCKSVR